MFGGDINIVAVDTGAAGGLVFDDQPLPTADNYQFVQVQFA
jgi:hypothetical protein